jgi:hypothetical protein
MPRRFDLRELLERNLEMVKSLAITNKISLEKDLDQAKTIYADDQKVSQIVYNLLSNAIKFTPRGGKAGIKVESADKNLTINVWDTGIGIRKEDQQMIFGHFQQLERNFNRKFKGTGLGLALSKKFVELMGGSLDVKSSPGDGSVFSFTIPLRNVSGETEVKANEIIEHNINSQPPRSILVVDDEPANLILADEVLTTAGYTVYRAENGLSGLHLAQNHHPDIILLDIQMPGYDGMQMLSDLRQIPEIETIPVIAMTAHAMKGDREDFIRQGFSGYISKPIDVSKLIEQIEREIRSHGVKKTVTRLP